MMGPHRNRASRGPSPALIVASLALIAALAGTAVAADPFASKGAVSKKKVKSIANKQISKRAKKLTVAKAQALSRVTVQQASGQLGANSTGGIAALCPAGHQALGGGFGTPVGSVPQSSQPSVGGADQPLGSNQTFDSWRVAVRNNNPSEITIRAWVVCAG